MSRELFREVCRREILGGKSGWVYLRLARVVFSLDPSRKALLYIRLMQWLTRSGWRRLAKLVHYRLATSFGLYVDARAQIGTGLRLPHPATIVIGKGLEIGERCLIYQQVTLGAAPRGHDGPMPRVGDDVTLYPGATIVGRGRVGSRVVVGANAVVTDVFGDDVVLAGVPARVVRAVRESDRVGAVRRK